MTSIKPFLKQGNYTVVNNFILDHIMPDVSPNAFKVLMYAIRKTVGWHRESDKISYGQFQEGCGIASRTTVSRAISELLERRYLARYRTGTHSRTGKPLYAYALNTDYEHEINGTENGLLKNGNGTENGLFNGTENGLFNGTENGQSKEKKHTYKHSDDDDDNKSQTFVLSYDEKAARELIKFNIDLNMARRLAETVSYEQAAAWCAHVAAKGESVRNPQGLVVTILRNLTPGEMPPVREEPEKPAHIEQISDALLGAMRGNGNGSEPHEKLWDEVQDILINTMARNTYESNFTACEPIGYNGSILTVKTSESALERIQARLGRFLAIACDEIPEIERIEFVEA